MIIELKEGAYIIEPIRRADIHTQLEYEKKKKEKILKEIEELTNSLELAKEMLRFIDINENHELRDFLDSAFEALYKKENKNSKGEL